MHSLWCQQIVRFSEELCEHSRSHCLKYSYICKNVLNCYCFRRHEFNCVRTRNEQHLTSKFTTVQLSRVQEYLRFFQVSERGRVQQAPNEKAFGASSFAKILQRTFQGIVRLQRFPTERVMQIFVFLKVKMAFRYFPPFFVRYSFPSLKHRDIIGTQSENMLFRKSFWFSSPNGTYFLFRWFVRKVKKEALFLYYAET